MNTVPSKLRLAELTAHALLQANAAAAADQFDLFLPPRAGVLHVVVRKLDSVAEFRQTQDWSLIYWLPLTRVEAHALYQAILSMPYGSSTNRSHLTALILVKDMSSEMCSSLRAALTSPRDVATISQFLRLIAFDAECPGA